MKEYSGCCDNSQDQSNWSLVMSEDKNPIEHSFPWVSPYRHTRTKKIGSVI
jgi:hypothetical protein